MAEKKARDGQPKKKGATRQRKRTPRPNATGEAGKKAADKNARKAPRGDGRRLSVAQNRLRDTVMLQRLAQGWGLEAIAAEAGITEDAARERVARARKNHPLVLTLDPVQVVEDVLLGLQLSIGDFEALSSAAVEQQNIAAAVGAKKGADGARLEVIQLMKDIGRLPEDLGDFRHLIDLKEVAATMVQAVEAFTARVAEMNLSKKARAELDAAAGEVRETFAEWYGGDAPAKPEIAA